MFKSENFLAPIGLCAISAVAIREGHRTYLCELNSQDPLRTVAELQPEVIVYSSSTGESKHYLKLNQSIKEKLPQVLTIMGGPHPTFYPDVIYEGNLDAICVGEGEDAFSDFLLAVSNNRSLDNIPNIVTKHNRDKFSIRCLIENLDLLPFPDYALVYEKTPLGRYPLKSFIASRGCSYDCAYCFNAAWRRIYQGKGKAVRRHSVDYIVDEISYVKERWPLSCVKFYDDIFTYSADDWLKEFSEKYRRSINLPFFVLTRADLFTEDVVKLLKYAGCHTISMSIESGNSDIRNKVLKRAMSDEQIINAHKLCAKYGIHTFTNCIIGLPSATIANEIESIDLAIRVKATWLECPIFHPYPGTELGEAAVRMGFYEPDYEGMHTSYQYKSVLSCFTEKEKNIQMNLSVLGPVSAALPIFKNLIMRYLIYMRHNYFFTLVYSLVKMHVLRKKIYVTKTNFLGLLRIYIRSLKQEWFRHENATG